MEVFKLLGIPNKTVIWNFNSVEDIDALEYISDPALGRMILHNFVYHFQQINKFKKDSIKSSWLE